jgi:hypothetical protein
MYQATEPAAARLGVTGSREAQSRIRCGRRTRKCVSTAPVRLRDFGARLESGEPGGLDEGVEDRGGLNAVVGLGDDDVLAANREGAEGALERVVVGRHAARVLRNPRRRFSVPGGRSGGS